jgi:hypothetical protein
MQITKNVILPLVYSRENVIAFLFFLILISTGFLGLIIGVGERGSLILVFSSIYSLVPAGFNSAIILVCSLIENG